MKRKSLYIAALITSVFSLISLAASSDIPSGKLLELHDCELIAGGCIASSESTLGGRSLLRVWNFDDGVHTGQDFSGLQVALLQVANTNLAFPTTLPTGSVIYLPPEASRAQRIALVDWLRAVNPNISAGTVEEKIAPIKISGAAEIVSLSIGQSIALETQSLVNGGPEHCVGMLWYNPRSRLNSFDVLLNRKSTVREKGLQLTWNNHLAKSVFLGSFGKKSTHYAANKTER